MKINFFNVTSTHNKCQQVKNRVKKESNNERMLLLESGSKIDQIRKKHKS